LRTGEGRGLAQKHTAGKKLRGYLIQTAIEQLLREQKPFILPGRLGSIHVLQGRVQHWKKFRWNASTTEA
jgi:hypothetical protein